eukprot:6447564-Lingulodinium_polyedra.AAC.1
MHLDSSYSFPPGAPPCGGDWAIPGPVDLPAVAAVERWSCNLAPARGGFLSPPRQRNGPGRAGRPQ